MRTKIYIFFFFLLVGSPCFAQEQFTIKGVVRDAQNGEVMPFASVFFAETTFGTATDDQGMYSLTVPKAGTYDLIVKFVGYKTYAAQLKIGAANTVQFDISVEPDAKSLGSVVVTAKKDTEWKRRMDEFRKVFLGETKNARQCRILNEEDIDFAYDKSTGVLEAFSAEPIIIENKALGYKIQYYLEQFVINYSSNMSSYYGYTVFEELESNNQRKLRRWEENRRKAYEGSTIHFFTSLYENKLKEAGFIVQVAKDIDGMGRVLDTRDANVYQFLKEGSNENSKSLLFENLLYITYENELETKEFLEADRKKKFAGHASASLLKKKPQRSWISLLDGYESIEFEPNGYVYNPVSFYSAGYWGFEKIAEMIPINYRPKGNN